jgi:methylmalonyl-CoA/ethylmalonyl-CoA epimerase
MDRIDHIAMAVRRAEAVTDYLVGELGLCVVHDEVIESAGVRLVYVDAGNTFIQLAEPVGAGAIATFIEERGEGLHHICFGVEDIPAALSGLAGEADAEVVLGGRGRRTCFLRGAPAGLVVELTEHAEAAPALPVDGLGA